MKITPSFLLFLFLLTASKADAQFSKELKSLAKYITGEFTSEAQHAKDTNFLNVRMTITPIWVKRTDGFWLYIEQAVSGNEERPYRQRVYKLSEPQKGQYMSSVFSLNHPQRYVNMPELLDFIAPDSLIEKEGCAVILQKDFKLFIGSTRAVTCPSELRNASYATSEISISKKELSSWDRGYDSNGKQVWGSVRGPYRFEKMKIKRSRK
jgi:hypothetical protein